MIARLHYLFLIVCMATTVHAGWIEDRDGKTIIHIKVDRLPDPNNTSPDKRADLEAVRLFRKRFAEIFAKRYRKSYEANPAKYGRHNWDNVEVQLHPFSVIELDNVENDLLAIAGGMAPDVLYMNFRKTDNYVHSNFLYPLDKPEDGYITGMTDEEIAFRIHPKIWPVIKRPGPDGTTNTWCVPFGGALGKVLVYRKDLFDARGLEYPTLEWTWDDLLARSKDLTNPSKGVYGLYLVGGAHESWHWMTFLWSAGGEFMEYNDSTNTWRCCFDSREAAVALDFYTRLTTEEWTDGKGIVRHGYTAREAGNSYLMWQQGKIGMWITNVDGKLLSKMDPAIIGMLPVPKGPTGIRAGELNSRMFGLFSGIKEPAVRDAAWEYVKFYDCEEAMALKTKIMVEGGIGQFLHPKYLKQFGYSEIIRLAPKGWAETFDTAIETSRPEPYGRNSNFVYSELTKPIRQAERLAKDGKLDGLTKEQRLDVMHELLKAQCIETNELMTGVIKPAERRFRRILAGVVLSLIIVVYIFVFRYILRVFTPAHVRELKQARWGFKRYRWAYILLLPALLSIFVWQYIPLMRGSVMAFLDYKIIGQSSVVYLDNFGDLLVDTKGWWTSVWHAMRYSFLVISLTFLPPIFLAIMLQEIPKGKILFRTLYYLPAVITGLVTIVLWKQFYEKSETGMLNSVMMKIPAAGYLLIGIILFTICFMFVKRLYFYRMWKSTGLLLFAGLVLLYTCGKLAWPMLMIDGDTLKATIPSGLQWAGSLPDWLQIPILKLSNFQNQPFQWLADNDLAMLSCVIPMVWAGMGPGCLIYLAALKGIPDDYYEAADIDGAGFIDKILFIVFPMLKALILINFVGVFIGSWYHATGNVLAMTGGSYGTEVVGLHIWYKAFTYLKFGPATAMAWMLGFILIGFTIMQLRILAKVEFRTTGNKD